MLNNPNRSFFKHCPKCGNARLAIDSFKSFRCPVCGSILFINTAAAVAGLVTNADGDLLVVIRNHDPAKGTWDLPGGFLDHQETLEQGLRRELREELNLDVTALCYFCSAPNAYTYGGIVYSTVDAAFCCQVDPSSAPQADKDEIVSAEFLPLSEIKVENFGLPSIRVIVAQYLQQHQLLPTRK